MLQIIRSSTGKGFLKRQGEKLDILILLAVVSLSLIGLILVYDASVVQAFKDYGDKYFYIKQQLIWMVLGIILMTVFSFFDYHNLKKLALPLMAASCILLLAVFIPGLGGEVGGAHRWLRLGLFSIQPVEAVKLAAVIFFASIFENKPRLAPFIIIFFLVSFIVGVLQKDLGSTIIFAMTAVALYAVSGPPLVYFLGLIPISLIGLLMFALSSTYRKQRILAFIDPFSDPQGYSYHIAQVLIALGSGGIFGLGLGQSRQKFEYIPEVTTDSIFAVVGEEFGFIGGILLIMIISILIFRGFKAAEGASDKFGFLLAFGITILLSSQAIINLAAMVSLIPLTGVPLPFISYGGSALLTNLVAVGILLNISKSSKIS